MAWCSCYDIVYVEIRWKSFWRKWCLKWEDVKKIKVAFFAPWWKWEMRSATKNENEISWNGKVCVYLCLDSNVIDFHPLTIPVASINLDPHADSSPVVAVGQEANLAGPNWRVQFIFGLEVRVLVAGDHLRQRKDTNWIKVWSISVFDARFACYIESAGAFCAASGA